MTRRTKWLLVGTVVAVGCGGAVATQLMRRGDVARDERGKPLSCIRTLALGGGHTCVLFEDGRVHCFGSHKVSGTGYLDAAPDRDPVKTSVRFSKIGAGYTEACGLSIADGTVWCWGLSPGEAFKQGTDRFPVQYEGLGGDNVELSVATDRVCVLKKDASVWCEKLFPWKAQKVLDGVEKLYARNYFACAKMKDRQVQCWGSNLAGELGRGSVSDANLGQWSEPPAPVVSVGEQLEELRLSAISACGLTKTRELWCWGGADFSLFADNRYWKGDTSGDELAQTVPMRVDVGRPFRDFVMGSATACILADDRSVWCWGGAGANDMLGEPSIQFQREDGLVMIEPRPRKLGPLGHDNERIWAGGSHYCVQKQDQSIWCWGNNIYQQVDRQIREPEAPLTRLPVACPDE